MEDITTELKLKIAQLEQEKEENKKIATETIEKNNKLITELIGEVADYKQKIRTTKDGIKWLYEEGRISKNEYLTALETLNG
jgi:hypothetical protein